MCFGFDQLSKAFSNYLFPVNSVTIKLKLESVRSEMTPVLMHFAENAQLICVDGRPERIEMHAFSNETKTALVLNGAVSQSSSGYMVFRPKRLAKFLSTERQPLKLAVSSIERAGTSKLVVASPRRCLHPDIMPLPPPTPLLTLQPKYELRGLAIDIN